MSCGTWYIQGIWQGLACWSSSQTIKSYGISGQIYGLISSFLSNRWLQVVLNRKSSQEYPVNAGIPQGFILCPTLFLLYINDLLDDVICDIAIYANGTTLYSKCDQASDLWSVFWSLATTWIYFWTWIWSMRHWTGVRNGLLISMLRKLS